MARAKRHGLAHPPKLPCGSGPVPCETVSSRGQPCPEEATTYAGRRPRCWQHALGYWRKAGASPWPLPVLGQRAYAALAERIGYCPPASIGPGVP